MVHVCILQKCIDQNSITYVSMATNYPTIKHKAFFKTLKQIICTNYEDNGQKFVLNIYDHTLMLYKNNDIEMSKFKVTPRIHWFSKVLLYLIN